MPGRLFQRRCKVHLIADDGTQQTFDGFRTQFTVEKSLRKEPNSAEVQLTNLAAHTRASLQEKGGKLILEAGYTNSLGQVFSGDIRTTDHAFARPEWVTKVQCGDGERAFAFASVNASFAPGSPLGNIIGTVADAFSGKKVDASKFITAVKQLPGAVSQGFSAYGKASGEMDRLLAGTGYDWSIQDGQLQLLKEGEGLPGDVVLLSPDTGLIGSPEHGAPDKKGKPSVLKAKSLLQQKFNPGRKVKVESRYVNGVFVVQKLKHTGDTAGGEWYSELEMLPSPTGG